MSYYTPIHSYTHMLNTHTHTLVSIHPCKHPCIDTWTHSLIKMKGKKGIEYKIE